MAQLPPDYAERIGQVFGDRMADAVRRQANSTRGFLSDRAADLTIKGHAAGINISPDDPVIDLGGRNRNEAFLVTSVANAADPGLTNPIAAAVGFQPGAASTAAFFAHRTLDPGVSTSRQIGLATFPGVVYFAVSQSGDQIKLAVADSSGVRVMAQISSLGDATKLRNFFQRSVPARDDRFDADLDHVYHRKEGGISRVPISATKTVATPYVISDGIVLGARTERVVLGRGSEDVVGEDDGGGQRYTIGDNSYAVVCSGLNTAGNDGGPAPGDDPSPDSILNKSYVATTDLAPEGMVWGDPGSGVLCSRASQDGCLGCCQTISGRYYTAALSTVAAGAVASGGAALGIVTIPVAWVPVAVGGVVGGLIFVAGLVHGKICESDCRTLYDRATGGEIGLRRYELRAAEVNSAGEQVAFRGDVILQDGSTSSVTIPRAQLMALLWGGGLVTVPSSDGRDAYVRLARKPGGQGLYLRTSRDHRRTNNLGELPAIRV
ncbi:hypothetical protein [Streptomyces sp. NPDC001975]